MAGKGFDAKAFLVNHTEKLAFGAFSLLSLALIGSSQWSTYKGTPTEIVNSVEEAKDKLTSHGWPEEEVQKYEFTKDKMPNQRVHDFLLSPISAQEYALSTKFVTSPWQGKEPLQEPKLLKLEDALASAGKVLIERPGSLVPEPGSELGPDGKPLPGTDPANPPTNVPSAVDENDEFAADPNDPLGGPNVVAGGGLGRGEGGLSAIGNAAAAGRPVRPRAGNRGAQGRRNRNGDDDPQQLPFGLGMGNGEGGLGAAMRIGGRGDDDDNGGLGTTTAVREAHPYKYAIVRAVFPIKEQIVRYMQATNSPSYDAAAQLFEVIDFNLERQELLGRSDQWSEWEPVDTQVALDVLEQSAQPEADVVRATVTDSVITMPLPPRIYGRWTFQKQASHPRIEKFELTEEEIQKEVELNAALLKMREEQEKTQTAGMRPKIEKRGFSSVASDARTLQADVLGRGGMGRGEGFGLGRGGMMMGDDDEERGRGGRGGRRGTAANVPNPNAALMELQERLGKTTDKTEQNKAIEDFVRKSVSADGELLLFRYLDFDVDPGKTYRYRVRLVLNNPNFGHLTSEANGEASVVAGETRPTDWSNVTKPVTIERDVYYFVKDIDTRRNKTLMSVYEWDTKLGTTVNGDIDLYPGQHITGVAKTNVIDPAKSKAEVKDYTFSSPDVFVDTHPDVALDRNLHKDLQLPGGSTGDAMLPEEALILVASAGELAVIDPVREAAEQARLKAQQKGQDTFFAWLTQPAAGAANLLPGLGDEDGMGLGNMGGTRLRNPLSPSGRGGRVGRSRGRD